MDRPPHDYAAAGGYSQQHPPPPPQHPPFGYAQPPPPQFHGGAAPPSFLPHQQFPYHHHHAPPQQLNPYAPPHPPPPPPPPPPHLLHLQQAPPQPNFPPHMPPPPHFHGAFDAPPPAPAAPPSDPELHKRIDKLAKYSAKNGPEFEAMIREKQQDNPEYAFLFGGEGHGYYRYMLWLSTRPPPFPSPPQQPSMHLMPSPMVGGPPMMHQPPYFYEQQQHSQFYGRPEYEQSPKPFKGLSGPLPTDVAAELNNVLVTLNGTKESIKSAKFWFVQRSVFGPALAEALRDWVFALDDSERQLHVIYLVNDILFESVQKRNSDELDNEALAFKPVLGSMLARIYHHPQIQEENQSKLQQLLQLWASNNIYDQDNIHALRNEMIGGQSANSFPGPPKELSAADSVSGLPHAMPHNLGQWHPDRQSSIPSSGDQEHPDKPAVPVPAMPMSIFPGSIPISASVQPVNQHPAAHLLPGQAATTGEKVPPYPLFPPGLIPGMVRKMQIGSGVPYSSMSPLDIPTIIPPSTVPQSETLERVSKFFKEIGEVNPSEGPLKADEGDGDEYERDYEREAAVRKGGACIPPPPNLQVDPETGTYPDGTVERKPGFGSSGRLGLGAAANPNEISQYDDVYTSYRKHRSTNYHSSMSTRATAR